MPSRAQLTLHEFFVHPKKTWPMTLLFTGVDSHFWGALEDVQHLLLVIEEIQL
jgi:hypothetical protein